MKNLTDLIKSSVNFKTVTNQGAHTLKCPVCNDTKVRAGFFFSDDHIGYSCFRGKCSLKSTKWVLGQQLPRKFKQLMDSLGITIPAEILCIKPNIAALLEISDEDQRFQKPEITFITIPEGFVQYHPDFHPDHKEYLENRGMFDLDYFISPTGNIAMPLRLQGGIIGYQERAIDKKIFKTTETNLMYVDGGQILDNCIIVEGIFDAKSVPRGVACLHDSVNPRQAYLLRSKTPILLPDRDSTKYLDVMADYDWRLCVPGWDAKDANEALVKYGRLVVAKMIHDGICDTPLEAEIRYKLWQKR